MRGCLLAIVLLALSQAVPARASTGLMEVTVHDRTQARSLEVYPHAGRRYVAGRPGNDYQLTLRNPTDTDLLAVVSVDGVNVINGETASWAQSGYIVPARGVVVVRGWRKSLDRVASFYFTAHANAYATRTGRPQDVGVIGVAVFRARTAEAGIARAEQEAGSAAAPAARPSESASRADARARPAPPLAAQDSGLGLGTGHGRSQISHARYASFQRAASTPDEIIAIHYDTHANLVALGVVQPLTRRMPEPFPGRFVPDPL